MKLRLTDKDESLLALLKSNARMPVSALARELGLSRSTVQDRLKRLEEGGVIAGYRVQIASEVEQALLRALIMIEIAPHASASVIQALKQRPDVEFVYTVSGKFDLIAGVAVRSSEYLDRLLDFVGATDGVVRTESVVVLSTKLDRR
ncbi:MAG: Lrp/AsnC family transcriptional regulator [Hyphomicrobiaceae bacterium]